MAGDGARTFETPGAESGAAFDQGMDGRRASPVEIQRTKNFATKNPTRMTIGAINARCR